MTTMRNQKQSIHSRKTGPLAKVSGGPILACIDLGTNSFHMIVCQANSERDHFDVITRSKEAVPFFRRSLTAHYIDDTAMRAGLRIVKDMVRSANLRGALSIIAVATSAVRESKNGRDFLKHLSEELRIEAKLVSGKEEARLIYLGVLWNMPELNNTFAIVDVGGGSTEIILADRSKTFFTDSYKLGAARLTQRFFRKGLPTPQAIQDLHREVKGVLEPAAAKLEECGHFEKLIGTSGTVQALARLNNFLLGKDNSSSEAISLSLSNLENIVSMVEAAHLSGEKIKHVSADRSQTLLAGSVVLLEAMRCLRAEEIIVCPAALREGVIVDRFLQTGWLTGELAQHRDPRSASVHDLLEKYVGGLGFTGSIEHAAHVAKLATKIFLQTQKTLHNYSNETGHLLWCAAMLHDVGMFIGRNGHHKHSYYLIKHAGLLGYSEEEVDLIANIARYHRGSSPKDSHEAYASLPAESRNLVTDMAAILRLAEALDRSHRQVITGISVICKRSQPNEYVYKDVVLNLSISSSESENGDSEIWALQEKKRLFEERFRVVLNVNLQLDFAYAIS